MNKLKETAEIIHPTNGIKVYVKIDYINNKISLVEPQGNLLSGKYQRKQWLFNERGVEFMNGWLNILEAMKYAIEEAKKMYEAELARTSEFKTKKDVEFLNFCAKEYGNIDESLFRNFKPGK